jgi:hypothetical protein
MPISLPDEQHLRNAEPPEDGGDGGDDGGEPIRWVVVASFWTSPQVHLARLKLESEDIDCQIQNENIIAADFLLAPAVGGIKILVPEFQAQKARVLLAKPRDISANRPPTAFGACPECGSTRIDRPFMQAKTFWAGVVAIMVLGPLALAGFAYYLIMWRPWHCRDCGNVFRREEGRQGFPVGQSVKPSPAAEQ